MAKKQSNVLDQEVYIAEPEVNDSTEVSAPIIRGTRGRKSGPAAKVLITRSLASLIEEFGSEGVVQISRKDYLAQHAKLRNVDLAKELGV